MSLSFEGSKERAGRRGNRFTIAPVGVSLERWRVEVEEEGEDKGEKWEAKAREEKRRIPPIQLLPARRSPPTKPAILTHFTSISNLTLSENKPDIKSENKQGEIVRYRCSIR